MPIVRFWGKIVEIINAYVGEQLAKIGHNEAPNKTSAQNPDFFSCFFTVAVGLELEKRSFNLSHNWGKSIKTP